MVTKYPDRMEVTHWSVVMDCGHQHVFTDEAIHKPTERRAGGPHGTGVDMYFCDKCSRGDKSGYNDGYCKNSVLHQIVMASPLLSPRKPAVAQPSQPQQQEEQQVQQGDV